MIAHTAKPTVGHGFVKLSLCLSSTANPVSKNPAITISTQAIASPPCPSHGARALPPAYLSRRPPRRALGPALTCQQFRLPPEGFEPKPQAREHGIALRPLVPADRVGTVDDAEPPLDEAESVQQPIRADSAAAVASSRAAVRPDPATSGGLAGLSAAEAARRLSEGQGNRVQVTTGRSVREILRTNIATRFNALLGALLVVILIVGPLQDALFGLLLVANSGIGIIQELRARRTLQRLAVLTAPRARVVRDARVLTCPVDRVVLGDLLALDAGDQIVVDGTVERSDTLEVNEALLTGESEPVPKPIGATVLSGSFAAVGHGFYRATRVGQDAYAASLATQARRFSLVRSELRDVTNRVLRLVTWVLVPTAVLLAATQFTLGGHQGWRDAVRGSVAGVVGMVPEGFVLLTSMAFAIGVIRLARRRVLVQELPAIEALARVDTVCLDKTGTLTEAAMHVADLDILAAGLPARAALGALAAADPKPNTTLAAI